MDKTLLEHLESMGLKTDKQKLKWLRGAMKFISTHERVGPIEDNCWKEKDRTKVKP